MTAQDALVLRGGPTVLPVIHSPRRESFFIDDPSELLEEFGEPTIEAARISDLGSDLDDSGLHKEDLRAYLWHLKRSVIRASVTGGVSFVLCLFSLFDLSLFFHGGKGLLHPWNSFFIGVAALCMLAVSVFSIFTAVQYLKSIVRAVCNLE